jgi:hypothetical protein
MSDWCCITRRGVASFVFSLISMDVSWMKRKEVPIRQNIRIKQSKVSVISDFAGVLMRSVALTGIHILCLGRQENF